MSATVRIGSREIREPTIWAVGALIALFTPVVWVPMLLLLMLWEQSDSVVLPIVVVAIVAGALTTWAMRVRTGMSRRVWSVGLWLLLVLAVFFVIGMAGTILTGGRGADLGLLEPVVGSVVAAAFLCLSVALGPVALRVGEVVFDSGFARRA